MCVCIYIIIGHKSPALGSALFKENISWFCSVSLQPPLPPVSLSLFLIWPWPIIIFYSQIITTYNILATEFEDSPDDKEIVFDADGEAR